jgi:hypothetical protein
MSQPVVFVSHVRIKDGKLDAVREISAAISARLEAEQPRTLSQLLYLDETGSQMTVVYVFADAESMDLHFEGADERARTASAYVDLARFEIYGQPSPATLAALQRAAAAAGASVTVQPDYLAGFLRLQPA